MNMYIHWVPLKCNTEFYAIQSTVVSKINGPPEVSPLDPIAKKLYNIKCCGNIMHQIVANMISQYLHIIN